MPDYTKGKIYKLYSMNDVSKVYYGSTVQPLAKRKGGHMNDFKRYKGGLRKLKSASFDIFELGDVRIELVESFSCKTKEELLKKEGEYIRNNECVNKYVAGRTHKEYYEDNFEKLKTMWKSYREKNSIKIQKQQKLYREKNKDKAKLYNIEYREKNKEKIRERRSQTYTCECGKTLSKDHKKRHERSKFHIEFMKNKETK